LDVIRAVPPTRPPQGAPDIFKDEAAEESPAINTMDIKLKVYPEVYPIIQFEQTLKEKAGSQIYT